MDQSILTMGTVVDTNDPTQMGRLRVHCPKWGDTDDTLVVDLPWASYVTPFGGILTRGERGPEEATTNGPVAYGMWAIPKVGATVVCMLMDGDVNHRVWIGSIHADHTPHTLPMGRYLDNGETGPVSSTEQPIEPLTSNMEEAFGAPAGSDNYERLTRAAENQASSIKNTIIDKVVSSVEDDRFNADDRTGYQKSRIRPDLEFEETKGNFDPQTYSITTPGLHSFIMDDSLKNGKIRIRSTSGNQIILDDTNERIYISTPEGKNWIEMDRAGNIDVYSDRRVSMHAEKGFNFTTEGEFRVSAENIHFRAKNDMRIHAENNFSVLADESVRLQADAGPFEIESTQTNFDLRAQTDINAEATTGNINITAPIGVVSIFGGAALIIQTGGGMSMVAAGGGGSGALRMEVDQDIKIDSNSFEVSTQQGSSPGPISFYSGTTVSVGTAPNYNITMDAGGTGQIHFNSGLTPPATPIPAAPTATPATNVPNPVAAAGQYAYTSNRIPIHEPWGRISNDAAQTDQDGAVNIIDASSFIIFAMTKDSPVLELTYKDVNANRVDLGDSLDRSVQEKPNWRR